MQNMSDEDLRTYADSYQPGYDTARSILAERAATREATAYSNAQGSITNLVRFLRDWPSSSYADSARADLQRTIQFTKYNSNLKVWITKADTVAYRSPTYDAGRLTFNSSSTSWPTTGTISNEGVVWVEMPVNFQGQDINVYVPQGSLSFSDPNYRAPSPPPPPPPPAQRYAPPPATTQPNRTTPVPPAAPIYVTIGSRRWAGEPSDSQSRRIANDMRLRRAMSITVDCRVGYDYGLTDCKITDAPDNITDRQWDGAIEYARLHVAPQYSVDGIATIGNWVSVTFDFKP